MTTKVLIPSGVLGLGFDREALAKGIAMQPDAIAIDGGSTDSGPYYLGKGCSKYARPIIKAEWSQLMRARHQLNVPLILGSCGTCGTDSMVDMMREITEECAKELGQTVRIACLYSNQNQDVLQEALQEGSIRPLQPEIHLDSQAITSLSHSVALSGAEQIIAALNENADIILAGRTTDTALIAALPLKNKEHAGSAWHGAKLTECGALCSNHPTSGVVMITFDRDGCTIEALAKNALCTPQSVSAHMLYENADPHVLYEPGGRLDVTQAHYKEVDKGKIRVTGAEWIPSKDYTVKLEGARLRGYQSMILTLVRDSHYVRNIHSWSQQLKARLVELIEENMGCPPESYVLDVRLIGDNATLGDLEEKEVPVSREIGVMVLVTAERQQLASEMARLINPHLLHLPLKGEDNLPTFAFPYSPAESERGPIYEFALNHVRLLKDPMEAFRLVTREFHA